MRKKAFYIFLILIAGACNSENTGDCLQTSGPPVQQEVQVMPFTRILVNEGIEMIISEGAVHEVRIETGKNLLNEIQVQVIDGELILSNHNGCNLFRDYAPAKIYVTAPDISEIRSSTQFSIRSEGVLTYPQLLISSEDYYGDYANTGDVYLTLNNTSLKVVFNNLSNCFVSGQTESLEIVYAAGNSRFEGEDLLAKQVYIFHRSSNDIIVHPTESLEGDIYSTGNVIAVNEPPVVNVTEHYKGKLIFQN